MTLLTQVEFAERHGVGKSAVSNWKTRGLLVFAADPERPGRKLVDAEKSDLLIRGTVDQTRGRPRAADVEAVVNGEASGESHSPRVGALSRMEQARLDELEERTRSRRIDNERVLGGLVELAEYERRAGDMARVIRERTNALIRQQAERLAAESDPRTIIALLSEVFDGLFNQVADEIDAAVQAERDADRELAAVEVGDDEDADA